MNKMKEETMNSCKFRFLGAVIATLFITSLIASPHRVGKNPMEITITKNATDLYQQFKSWCDDNGKHFMTQTRFGNELKKMNSNGFQYGLNNGFEH